MHRHGALAVICAMVVAACGGAPGGTPVAVGPTATVGVPSTDRPATAVPTLEATKPPAATPKPSEDTTVRDGESWLAFQWQAPGGDGIFLIRPDGTGQHRIGKGSGVSQFHPDWSPDGQRLAFVSATADDQSSIWIINVDGSGAEQIVTCADPCNTVSYPDWSPDGTAVLYGMDGNRGPNGIPRTFSVGRYDLSTKKTSVALERTDGMTAEQPRLSPDGKTFVYVRYKDPASVVGSAIFTGAVRGHDEKQLTEWTMLGAYPDWSPDGTRIVFNTRDLGSFQEGPGAANILTMAADGSNLTPLTTFGNNDTRATQPRWTPDGSAIVFTKVDGEGFGTRNLASIAPDGSGLRLFTPTAVNGTHPTLRPIP